jgi:hypothetical protein
MPKAKYAPFVRRPELKKIERQVRATLNLASTHDPDIMKWIIGLCDRINILERQVETLGVKQYRVVRSSKLDHQVGIYAQRAMKIRGKK